MRPRVSPRVVLLALRRDGPALAGALPSRGDELVEPMLEQQVASAIEVQREPFRLVCIRPCDDVPTSDLLVACDRLRERVADAGALSPARAVDLERRSRLDKRLQERLIQLWGRLESTRVDVRVDILPDVVA